MPCFDIIFDGLDDLHSFLHELLPAGAEEMADLSSKTNRTKKDLYYN